MKESINRKISDQCERILYALLLLLVFEGILRKAFPALSNPIFFLKDILCVIIVFKIAGSKFPDVITKLKSLWFILFILFLPILHFTSFKDPVLAVFACKQYLLYIVIGVAVAVAFPIYKEQNFRRFIFFTSLMIIPTTLVAVLQNSLPSSHWINLSVGGDSLEAFSAGGYLRVSSTFSFTAQYSWFLIAESFFLAASFFMPPKEFSWLKTGLLPLVFSVLGLMLAISAFITGGRTAVLGCASTILLGFLLIAARRPGWFFKGALVISFCAIILSAVRTVKPEFFMAYDERSSGTESLTHSEEIINRILGGFTEWVDWFTDQDLISIWFGNGLGIMSNGAAAVSSYASEIRQSGFWTEGDVATTFWEGGIYLAVIWYGFRLSMIFLSYRLWRMLKNKTLASAASVPFAYVCIQGLTAQFGIQSPLSIWWWLAIGIIIFLARYERYKNGVNIETN